MPCDGCQEKKEAIRKMKEENKRLRDIQSERKKKLSNR